MISSPGIILSFDDHFIKQWLDARDIFEKYNARATFFISEFDRLSDEQIDGLLALQNAGHCIGCHSLRHKDALDTIEKIGADKYLDEEIIPAINLMSQAGIKNPDRCFAYPVSSRNEHTDKVLLKIFDYLRCGLPQKLWREIPIPIKSLKPKQWLRSISIDENGGLEIEKICELLDTLKKENSIVIFYSHSIQQQGDVNHITPAKLEAILQYSADINLFTYSFADLD